MLIREPDGLVVEMTDGAREYNTEHYRLSTFYDLAKTAILRLAFAQGKEHADAASPDDLLGPSRTGRPARQIQAAAYR